MNALMPYLTRSVRPQGQAFRRRLGFSAIEVTAVAAIISVLALIVVPVVNKRVDESKIVAAQDDMSAIQKAEELAFGYTGHYFRLCDLDRPTPDSDKDLLASRKVPRAWWNRPIRKEEGATLKKTWTGPYMHLRRSISLNKLVQDFPNMVNAYDNLPGGGAGTVGGGPIMLFNHENDWSNPNPPSGDWDTDVGDAGVLDRRQYPIDPWGNPYLFFGPGLIDPENNGKTAVSGGSGGAGGGSGDSTQFNWPTAVVYSLGPDGLPGLITDSTTLTGLSYLRENQPTDGTATTPPAPPVSNLGLGDDLKREF